MPDSLHEQLTLGLAQFDLTHIATPLATYVELLHKWNQTYNLTAIRDEASIVSRHILDSLAILPWVQGPHVLDVGSGGGLPGIPLAIARPDWSVTLLDSNGKKTRFLQAVQRELKLPNVTIINERAERYQPTALFTTIVSRAFSNLIQMTMWTKNLIADHGIWLAMKGLYPAEELKQLNYVYDVKSYNFAGIEGERCCIIIHP